jgi:PAS domain S-box-containing protein
MSGEFLNSFALMDADGRLIFWDDGFAQEFAFSASLLRPGVTYAEIARAAAEVPDAKEFLLAHSGFDDIDSLLQDGLEGFGRDRAGEYRTRDGTIIRVDQHRTSSGGIRRFARDVTAERDVGDKLTRAYRRLDATDAGLGAVLTEIRRTPDGNYFYQPIDEALRRLLDLPPEFAGQDAIMFFARMKASNEEHAHNAAQLEHSALTLECIEQDYQVRDGKDRMRWLRHSLMPRREADGTVIFSGVLRDVTREKHAEDQLQLLRSVVVHSPSAVAIFETVVTPEQSTRFLYVNEKFTQLYGGSAEGLVDQPMEVLTRKDFREVGEGLLAAAVERDDGLPFEYQATGKGGRIFWVEVRVKTVQKFDDGGFRWAVISRDVSKRKDAQDELVHAKERAEASDRAKGDFLANMSHELRTPLNAIIGFTELIEQGVARTGWTPAYTEYLADVSESGRHLLDLINTVLDLSKIGAGQLELNRGPVDLGELARTSLTLLSGMANDGRISLSADIPAECLKIDGDYLKLKQVLLNIVSNAIKFTPSGGTVKVDLRFTENDAMITVADTGCGISNSDLQRVMLPFVQVENSISRKFGGSGLGLPIARALCSLHSGSLEIDSVEGQGTIVRVSLPLSNSIVAQP